MEKRKRGSHSTPAVCTAHEHVGYEGISKPKPRVNRTTAGASSSTPPLHGARGHFTCVRFLLEEEGWRYVRRCFSSQICCALIFM